MKGSQSVWMVIHLARSEDGAQRIADMLGGEGLVVKTHPIYRNKTAQDNLYEILVLKSESEEARNLLIKHGFLS